MKIEPTYVTFKQAKLLKEKGFNLDNPNNLFRDYYLDDGKEKPIFTKGVVDNKSSDSIILAPEQWRVVEWLRVKHSIWVEALLFDIGFLEVNKMCFQWRVYNNSEEWETNIIEYKTPQEAYSAAFDYVLTKLI